MITPPTIEHLFYRLAELFVQLSAIGFWILIWILWRKSKMEQESEEVTLFLLRELVDRAEDEGFESIDIKKINEILK